MVVQEKMAEFSSETVRNVAGTLIWLARPPEPLEELSRNWLADPLSSQNRDQWREAIETLTDSFRARHDAVVNVYNAFQERIQKAAKNFSPSREMDPDDIAVPELEKSEAYFREEREALRGIRDVLQRTGGVEAHGAEVFVALERLDTLFEYLVTSLQDQRWAIMIHDGTLAPSTGGTCASGSEFMAAMKDS